MKIYLPKVVKSIIDRIYESGYEAFIVGGCIRDCILGITPNDYDITTNATPNKIMDIFKEFKLIKNGIKHGTVGILIDGDIYEITTYRIESGYEDSRRPKSIEFTSNIVDDLKRRDFTINAMAYNDKKGLIDEFGGIVDLKNRVIKTVGNPEKRFNEDGLRIIRAIRFSSKLGFNIEDKTLNSIYKNYHIVKNISIERITDEINKIITSKNPQNIILLYKTKIFEILGIYYNFNNDNYLRLEKQLKIISLIDEIEYKLLLLQYIISNEAKDYNNRNYIVNILIYPNKVKDDINNLIEYMYIDESNLNKIDIKYILNKIGYSKFEKILNLKNIHYSTSYNKKSKYIKQCTNLLKDIINNKECYTIKDLKVNGNDLKELGYKGNEIGNNLNYLLEEVIKNTNLNSKKLLIKKLNKI